MANAKRMLLVAVAGLAAVLGCKKKESPTIGADSSVVINTPAFRVQNIELGKSITADKRVVSGTDNFARTDTIYASVVTEGSAPSKVIVARWTFEDGQVVKEETQTISPTGTAVTEFHISKPSGWPIGRYQVEILVDGASVGTQDFAVK